MVKIVEYSLAGEEYIPLIALLKRVRIAGSGGEAQRMVEEGCIRRNGEVELRKRAKIRAGECIEGEGWRIAVKV